MKKEKFSTRVLAEVAIFAALGFALDAFQGGLWKGVFVNGGSIGFAMVPVYLISFRRGLLPGILCGFILSLIQMLGGIYVVNASNFDSEFMKAAGSIIQVMLDYVLAYTVVGFAGVFTSLYVKANSNKMLYLIIGCVFGGILKYASHTIAGIMFWPGELWGITGSLYSFLYNGLYCIPNIIISTIVMCILHKFYPQFLNVNKAGDNNE